MTEKSLMDLVLEKRKEGKVVFWALPNELCSADIKEFIKQPADGILWDLNRLEEVALTFIDDPKWTNDFAVALTIRALKDEISMLQKGICGTNAELSKAWATIEKLEEKLKECYDLHEVALEMVENE